MTDEFVEAVNKEREDSNERFMFWVIVGVGAFAAFFGLLFVIFG